MGWSPTAGPGVLPCAASPGDHGHNGDHLDVVLEPGRAAASADRPPMTMSCPEVVYQAYYPYLYQRPSAAASRATPFPPFQYDRFNVQRPLDQPSTSSLGESTASGASGSGGTYLSHHPPSSVGSVSSGGGGVGSPGSPPLSAPSLPRHKEEDSGGPRSAEGGVPDDEDGEALHSVDLDSSRESSGAHAQYLSANCVVFTHYSGDAAAVVDEHFSRALAYADAKAAAQGKESSPMTARNFPASFWNSNYQSPGLGSGVAGMAGMAGMAGVAGVAGVPHHGDLYGDPHPYHHAAASSSATDPWHSHYPQYSAHHHRAVHDYHHHHNMAAQYGGLLLPPTRLPAHAHQYSKEWAPNHPHHAHHSQSMAHHHGLEAGGYSYPGMAGLEAQVQESSKDLYWI